jgi:hypothetical protein
MLSSFINGFLCASFLYFLYHFSSTPIRTFSDAAVQSGENNSDQTTHSTQASGIVVDPSVRHFQPRFFNPPPGSFKISKLVSSIWLHALEYTDEPDWPTRFDHFVCLNVLSRAEARIASKPGDAFLNSYLDSVALSRATIVRSNRHLINKFSPIHPSLHGKSEGFIGDYIESFIAFLDIEDRKSLVDYLLL